MFGLTLAFKVQAFELPSANGRLAVHHGRLIVVILFEQLLNAISPEQECILLNCLLVLPVVIIDMLLIEIVLLYGWNVRSLDLFIQESLPVEVFEPRVRFNLRVSV